MIKDLTITNLKIGKNKVSVYFHDEKIDLSPNAYVEFTLFKGRVLTQKEFNEIKYRDELDKFMTYSIKTLSNSRLSEKALIDKLEKKGAKARQVSFIVKEMKKNSLLDDDELVSDYLEIAHLKHIGQNKIKDELYKKGISKEKIETLSFENELEEAILNIPSLERKYSSLNYEAKKRHIYENLLRLGFDYHVSTQALSKISEKDDKIEKEALNKDVIKAFNKYKTKYQNYELKEKMINYLLGKGYRYKDIEENKEIKKICHGSKI